VSAERCRVCDAVNPEGEADPDDPAPGICPTCFDRRMADVTAAADVLADVMPRQAFLAWSRDQLEHYAGMTPSAAELFLRAAEGRGA
jgi:hypothetical protein